MESQAESKKKSIWIYLFIWHLTFFWIINFPIRINKSNQKRIISSDEFYFLWIYIYLPLPLFNCFVYLYIVFMMADLVLHNGVL